MATLADADFAGAVVAGAQFGGSRGFTKLQLYSTASYQVRDLQGIELAHGDYPWETTDLEGLDLSRQNLSGAKFGSSNLDNADMTGANLTDAYFGFAKLRNARFNGAIVTGAQFDGAYTLTKEQLYSTASYQARDLRGVSFGTFSFGTWDAATVDLTGWDFSGLHLTGANFSGATLKDASLTGAIVNGANFGGSNGFTKEQLYSTASYQAKDLQGIALSSNDLTGWDFRGQNLRDAKFNSATLTNSDLTGAIVTGLDFNYTSSRGFTKELLYSTASYQTKNLNAIGLGGNDMTGWDLSGQDLTGASFGQAVLRNTKLTGANLTNAYLGDAVLANADLTGADTRGARGLKRALALSRNTILPDGKIEGLQLATGERLIIRDDDGISDATTEARPPIPVTIEGNMSMATGSVLRLQFDSDEWNSLISFESGIPIQLGGILELTFDGEVRLPTQVGRTLKIFNWAGVAPSGQFAIRSPYAWDVTKLYTTGEVTLLSVPEPRSLVILLVGASAFAVSRRVSSSSRRR